MLGPIVFAIGLLLYLMQGHVIDNATIIVVGIFVLMVAVSVALEPKQ